MQPKSKLAKAAILGLLATFGLCACDEIQAKPSDYNTPIVTVEGYSEDIYNDIMSVIYDSIHDEGIGEGVLNEVLFEYATSIIGRYNSIITDKRSSSSKDTVTLKAAVADIHALGDGSLVGGTVAQEFINAHSAYWTKDQTTGKRDTSEEAQKKEFARVYAKWNTIEERIAEKMYNAFNSTSYSDRNLYSEQAYLIQLSKELAKVKDPSTLPAAEKGYITFLDPDVEPENVFIAGYLHREYYQTSYNKVDSEQPTTANPFNTYIEDTLVPEIYRQLLVEQYLLDKSYNTLGGSYARKVNIIAIANNSNYPKASSSLMDYAVQEVNKEPEGTALVDDPSDNNYGDEGLALMKKISKLWTGVNLGDATDPTSLAYIMENNLLKSNGFEIKTTKDEEKYYGGTEYGTVLDNYDKIEIDRNINDETIENDFTGNGTYSKETGKLIKQRETAGKDHTTTGWYIKSTGLSELPDTIKTRLFSVGVSNALDIPTTNVGTSAQTYDRYQYDETTSSWKYDKENDYNPYVARINGRYYLKNDKVLEEDDPDGYKDVLFYDSTSSTYYIIQVVEAVTTSKLSKTGSKNYATVRSAKKMEEIINEVLKVVGTGESYSTTSTKYWLDQAQISYHDESVYNYFKTNYPDLFK